MRSAAAVVAAFTLVAAACGSDDDAEPEPESTEAPDDSDAASDSTDDDAEQGDEAEGGSSSETADQPTGAPIKIGFVNAQSGMWEALYGPTTDVATAWMDWVNDNGGINGHPVEIIFRDSQSDGTAGLAAVTELVEQEDVHAMMLADAGTEFTAAEYLSEQNIAVIGENGFQAGVWTEIPNFFTSVTIPPGQTLSQPLVASQLGLSKVGGVACAEDASCADLGNVLADAAPKNGVEFTGLSTVSASAPNYTAQCLEQINQETDLLVLALDSSVVPRMMADCIQQGYEGYFSLAGLSFDPAAITDFEGTRIAAGMSSFPWWSDAEPVQLFREVLETYAPDVSGESNAVGGLWTALELFRAAMSSQDVDEVTRDVVLDGYYQLEDETLDGLLPQPVTFTRGEPSPYILGVWLFTYTVGDENPEILIPETPCNGAEGDMGTFCQEL